MTAPVVHRDLVYASPPGFRPLALDLYLPPTPAALLCLYLHGGGWRTGSRRVGPGAASSWAPSFFEEVAALGVALASVDYRLTGEATFPAQLEDVQAAGRFLAERRAEYGLPHRVTMWGVSAGGHLAALHALRAMGTDQAVSAVVCWYAPTDLDALCVDVADVGADGDRSADSREGRLVGGALDDRPDLVAAASPVNWVAPGPPPFLFVHGSADVNVPPRQSTRLAERLTAAGGSATVELIAGSSHMFPELDDAATRALVHRSLRFLRE